MRAAIITVSTSVAAGRREDLSGRALAERARAVGAEVVAQEVVPDDRTAIEDALQRHCAPQAGTALVFTTGGTGLTPDDVTPEATKAVISREVAGVAGQTLIVNFPGSPNAIEQLFGLLAPVLEHAVALLRREHGSGH